MSTAEGAGGAVTTGTPWLNQALANARGTLATLVRPPRRVLWWPSAGQMALAVAGAAVAVLAVMVTLDAWAIAQVPRLPARLVEAFDRFTDLGKSGFFLWPLGLALIALALLSTSALQRMSRLVLAAWAVRLGFVLTAIAVPGLFVTIVKRLIGRARPRVAGNETMAFVPFGWKVDYASLPSGHATTAFAALVAIGAIFPQARALLWIYALLIALSRVVLMAHYPSDVLAGALVGAAGAWLVQQWFAARGLGFAVTGSGTVRPMPGPGLPRIVKALARRLHAA
ncbi:MAG: phosphatase PAP2 family protein [Xanthobacteraceae bacterium]|nr:phosphatase PAP2 family protein [Xanthobacteraceae bacterium]